MMNDPFQYQDLLKLDTLFNILEFDERINLHLKILGRGSRISKRCTVLLDILSEINWEAPSIFYGQDRLQYYRENGQEYPIELYPQNHLHLWGQIRNRIKQYNRIKNR